jgi:glycosyltransferase involved in cell wall biosynthesis
MHILHVTLGFYPAQAWGGPVKIVHQNGKELVRRGHQVTVYCTNLLDKKQRIQPGTFERELDGMRVVYFNTWHLPRWPGTLGPIWLPDLPAYLKQEIASFDVVHLNGYRSPMLLPVVRAARGADIPFVTQPHGTLPIIVNSFWVKRVYDWLFGGMELEGIGALIALQESECQQALAHGVPADRIEIIPNGIDPHERAELPEPGGFRRRFGLALDRPLILFLGRINKKKGTDMLIQAFARLKSLDAQLAIVGPDDGQLNEVRDLIRRNDLDDRVILPGLLSGQDVLGAFQDADLFVLPCRADTFPVTIMEACLTGTPMVITDRCEIAHLIRDRVADIVPFDADAFAAAMQCLLTDKERYERYRANSQAVIADTFSIKAVVDHLEAVYRRVIAEKQQDINIGNG